MKKSLRPALLLFALFSLTSNVAPAKTLPDARMYAPQFLPPVLVAPSNTATGADVNGVQLTWQSTTGTTGYKVELADNRNFFNATSWTTAATNRTTAALKQTITYYWRVTSLNGTTEQGVSATWSFTTTTLSGVPTLSAPNNAVLNVSIQGTTLQWTNVSEADKYTVQFADNAQFINPRDSTLAGNTFNTGILQRSTKYFWRVRAENVGGTSAWSAARFFTTLGLPTAPALTTPADLATNQALTGITLRWATVTGANTYTVQYADNPDFVNFKYIGNCASNFGITPNLRPSTTFYWRVFASNTLNNSTSPISPTRSFTTAAGTNTPTPSSPPDGFAGISPTGATLQWNALSAATNTDTYIIEWADNPNFVSPTLRITSATTLNTGNIIADKTYYWRVKGTYNTGGTSDFSAARSFSTAAANAQIALALPTNQTKNQPTGNANLSWAAFANATTYTVEIADNRGFSNATTLTTTATNTDFNVPTTNTNFFWRVKANTATGTTPWSATWVFSSAQEITLAPTLNLPANNAQNTPLSGVSLTWQAVTNATDYEVQWSANASFNSDVNTFYKTTTNTFAIGFTLSTNYYWRVRARNAAGVGVWSEVRKFATLTLAQAPALSSPTSMGVSAPVTTANFSWSPVPFTTDYDVQITPNNNFSSDIRNFSVSGTTKTVDTFRQNLNYYWRVRGRNNTIESPWSETWSFKTTQLAQAPTLSAPANNAIDIALSGTNLAWNALTNATYYEVEYAPTPVFSAGVEQRILTTTNNATLALVPTYTYYWRVRGGNAGGVSPWSAVYNFTAEELTNIVINATQTVICASESSTITASGGVSYAWSTGSANASLVVVPTQTTTYTVTVTKTNGTTITLAQTITVNALPTPAITGNLAFCTGSNTNLVATGGSTYEWSNGTTTANNVLAASGTYTVTATVANGCTATATVNITVNALPTPTIIAPNGFCTGGRANLIVQGASTYAWSSPDLGTAQNPTVYVGGTYTVTATNVNNCTGVATIVLLEYALPPQPIISTNGSSFSTTATDNLQWFRNNTTLLGANSSSFVASESGAYIVCTTNANNCQACSQPFNFTFVATENAVPSAMNLYPNPTTHDFTIVNLPQTELEILVFDATGKLLQTIKPNGATQQVSLTEYADGLYQIVVATATDLERFKVLKQTK